MTKKAKAALENVRRALETETAPARLSKTEYLEVIEELSADLEGAIDATRQELGVE